MRKCSQTTSSRFKLIPIVLFISFFVLCINSMMYFDINQMIDKVEKVYSGNINLNQLSEQLSDVQTALNAYLQTKSSDSMEAYYEYQQMYEQEISKLNVQEPGTETTGMIQDIKQMSEAYFQVANQTVQAKRGRLISKYKDFYQKTEQIYHYIQSYINALNRVLFQKNTKNYQKIVATLQTIEAATTILVMVVSMTAIFFILFLVRTMTLKENIQKEMKLTEARLQTETSLKEAQLKYLQAQIHPHFLFNTLNAGAQLAMMEDADKTYDYLQAMSKFFRYKIGKSSQTATLQEEIELVEQYLYILNVRFSGEIHFEKQVDESLLTLSIPKMVLQPIVENSIKYGLRGLEREGTITLTVRREEENGILCIFDNGNGIQKERLEEILSGQIVSTAKEGENGVGLKNVTERLHLLYQEKGRLTITSEGLDHGTKTEVIIPLAQTGGH